MFINYKRFISVICIILFFCTSGCITGDKEIHKAVREGKIYEVKRMIDEGYDLNVKNNHGYTALMVAESIGNVKVIKLLRKAGALADYHPIIPSDVYERMQSLREDFIIVDMRTEKEYKEGHIEGAVYISFKKIKSKDSLNLDKNKDIFVVCAKGNSSRVACMKLLEKGYKKVYNVEGGMRAWNYNVVK